MNKLKEGRVKYVHNYANFVVSPQCVDELLLSADGELRFGDSCVYPTDKAHFVAPVPVAPPKRYQDGGNDARDQSLENQAFRGQGYHRGGNAEAV